MLEPSPERLDAVFQALSDPTRRAMLHALAEGERGITELAATHGMCVAAACKHVKVLGTAGLVTRTVRGRSHMLRLSREPLGDANDWLRFFRRYWGQRLGALEQML